MKVCITLMKKNFAILLLLSTLALSGCGNSNSSPQTTDPVNLSNNTEKDRNETSEINTEPKIVFEETVVVDNEECSIIISGIEPDSALGYAIKVKLENKSADKEYMFAVENAAVNGVQTDPFFATTVSAGKKANDSIHFTDSSLKENEVGEFSDIEILFRVYDSNDWLADEVAREIINIYPLGQDNVISYLRKSQPEDNVIVDNEYIKAIITGYDKDNIWGYTANLFLENKTDKEIMFSTDEVSINGYMIDPFFAKSVMPSKCAFSSISWSDNSLEENDILEVEEIEFLFKAYDNNDWTADPFVNEKITLQP